MNYGEEFVKLYNKEFEVICSNSITKFENHYDTNYSFTKVERLITVTLVKEIDELIKLTKNNRNLFDVSHRILKESVGNYTFDVTISLVNNEVKEIFILKCEKEVSEIISFSEYVGLFAKWEAIQRYFLFIKKNFKELNEKFISKNIGNSLSIIKSKNELHSLVNLDKQKAIKESKIKVVKKQYDNPFTENEKFILIHYLFKHERSQEKKISVYELTLILKIACEVFADKKLNKIKDTIYEKYHQGYEYYSKPKNKKKSDFKILIEKCESFKLNSFAEYLNHELFKI